MAGETPRRDSSFRLLIFMILPRSLNFSSGPGVPYSSGSLMPELKSDPLRTILRKLIPYRLVPHTSGYGNAKA
jgi:hypothetical protein